MHPTLEGDEHLLHRDADLAEYVADKLEHDWRTADDGGGVMNISRILTGNHGFECLRNNSHLPFPEGVGFFHDDREPHFVPAPHIILIGEKELGRSFGAVNDVHVAEMSPVFLYIGDGRAKRSQSEPSGDEQDVLAVHVFHGEAGAEGTADADMHAAACSRKIVGEVPGFADAKLDVFATAGGGGNAEGRFADPWNFQHDELPGIEGKPLPIVLVDDPYAVEVFRVRESRHSGDLGFVGVFIHAKVVLPEVSSLRMLLDVDVFQTGVQIRPPRRVRWQ